MLTKSHDVLPCGNLLRLIPGGRDEVMTRLTEEKVLKEGQSNPTNEGVASLGSRMFFSNELDILNVESVGSEVELMAGR